MAVAKQLKFIIDRMEKKNHVKQQFDHWDDRIIEHLLMYLCQILPWISVQGLIKGDVVAKPLT